ncbi:MAG TPA: VWA domain-containing protein [Gemmatimonadaceae bacterium]
MGVSVRTAAAAAIVVLAAPVLAQQQQPPTFRSGTQVVEVDVRVFDKDGRFVTNLTADDFEITEDGQPQAIQSLTLIGAEPSAAPRTAPPAPSAPAPTAPSAPAARPAPRQTWVFMFDTSHLSDAGLHRVQDALSTFVGERFQNGDLGGVIVNGTMVNNRLTTETEELRQAILSIKLPRDLADVQRETTRMWPRLQDEHEAWLIAEKNDGNALGLATARACEDRPELCESDSDGVAQAVRSKAIGTNRQFQQLTAFTYRILETLANGLARIPGPKTVIFLSDGFSVSGTESRLREAVGQMNRAGAHIYAIDARGLDKGRNADLLFMSHAEELALKPPRFDEQVDGPNSLAVDTGGMFIQNFNDIGDPLQMIQRDAGTYYVLGYAPTNQTFDGKYREIRVHVKRDGVKVRARRGYLAIEPAKMLTPVPSGSEGPASPSGNVGQGFSPDRATANEPTSLAPDRGDVPAPVIEPTTATALRTEIEGGGFVTELRRTEAPAEASPAAKGWAAYQRGDVETAVRELTGAAASPDAHAWVHYVLGLGHLALADYPHAASSWERVRAMAPDFEPVYMNLADAYLLQKDGSSALKVLEAARARWPKDDEVYNAIGVILLRAGSAASAIDSFKQAIKVNPREGLGYFNLASAYHVFYNARPGMTSDRQFRIAHQVRDMAIANYRKYLSIGGPYEEQAKAALKALNAAK